MESEGRAETPSGRGAERPWEPWVRIGAASRPLPGETANGDGWAAGWDGAACRIAVVDGLGHGPDAAAATRAALAALAARPALGPADAVRACHAALAGTRGAAVAVARIEPAARRLTFAGVGNVEGRLWPAGVAGRAERPVAYRGIVGAVLPTVRAFEFALADGWLLVLHTDGVSARFALDQVPAGARGDPQALAEAVLTRWGRPTDDATVVAAAAAQRGPPAPAPDSLPGRPGVPVHDREEVV